MSRWKPDGQVRLQQAALELYSERGYDQTTVAEIARRAGLTERTFFRYFADKREVLFVGVDWIEEALVEAIDAAPAGTPPIVVIATSLQTVADVMQEGRPWSSRRQAVINAHPELQERELIKLASLAAAIAQALRERGVKEPAASLAAQAGMAVFRIAFERWVEPINRRRLATIIRDSFRELAAITGEGPPG
jgi:AcrR family transcriptional regulator